MCNVDFFEKLLRNPINIYSLQSRMLMSLMQDIYGKYHNQ